MRRLSWWISAVTITVGLGGAVTRGDILATRDGRTFVGKITGEDDKDYLYIPDQSDASNLQHLDKNLVVRVIYADDHSTTVSVSDRPATAPAVLADPAAPPIAAVNGPSYYLIPLHGEVGNTVLASILEKSLADAEKRKPTVVILDIDSPGGLVDEAKQIVAILHRYNKKLRIVAFTNQDLSAAAVLTLSCKEIYVKSTSTIGAATSYISTTTALPPKLEEKMQSAWRAVARNSAEEGAHEPLLADAMIDNDQDLHWETVDGKPVVKEGNGDHMICRKGKVLTLTSHEAVDCGLASGITDDLDELSKALKLDNWTEVKGVATLLADQLPRRVEAYQAEIEKIRAHFQEDLAAAIKADPSQSVTTVTRVLPGPVMPVNPNQPYRPNPNIPRIPNPRPMPPTPPRVIPGQPQVITETRGPNPATWKSNSISCVAALIQAETDIKEAITLATAYGHGSESQLLGELLTNLQTIRTTIYEGRNKYSPIPVGDVVTREIGSQTGNGYVTVNRAGAPLTGLRCDITTSNGRKIISHIQPVFGPAPESHVPTVAVAAAKDGYVVGGLQVDADATSVLAIKIIFIAFNNGHVDPADTYTSDWLGEPDDSKPQTIAGNGEVAYGTAGSNTLHQVAIGLVVKPAEDKK